MEAIGMVNEYRLNRSASGMLLLLKRVHSINLSHGTTPFIVRYDGWEYSSGFYQLTSMKPKIILAFFRPTLQHFNTLNVDTKEYVLRGCLLKDTLATAISLTLRDDPIALAMDWQELQEFNQAYYGRRLL